MRERERERGGGGGREWCTGADKSAGYSLSILALANEESLGLLVIISVFFVLLLALLFFFFLFLCLICRGRNNLRWDCNICCRSM